jgi:Methyltransferase TRM13
MSRKTCRHCTDDSNTDCTSANTNQNEHPTVSKTRTVSSVTGYDVQRLIYKIQRIQSYLPSLESIPRLNYSAPKQQNDNGSPTPSGSSSSRRKKNRTEKPPKHIGQIESIVEHMKRNNLLSYNNKYDGEHNGTKKLESDLVETSSSLQNIRETRNAPSEDVNLFYLVEFGCGTAKLSDHVSSVIIQERQQQKEQQHYELQQGECKQSHLNYRYILIDQQPMRAVERYCDGRIRSRHQEQYVLQQHSKETRAIVDDCKIVQRFISPISQIQLHNIIYPNQTTHSKSTTTNNIDNTAHADFTTVSKNNIVQIVGMAKHLCGSATDDAIQCIRQFHVDTSTTGGGRNGCCSDKNDTTNCNKNISYCAPRIPLVVATCCHYACDPKMFMNPNILGTDTTPQANEVEKSEASYLQFIGMDERDIEVLMIVSQWASIKVDDSHKDSTASSRTLLFHDVTERTESNIGHTMMDEDQTDNCSFPPKLPPHPLPMTLSDAEGKEFLTSTVFEETFTRAEKQELGQYSKLLIDTARAYYLKHVCHYTNVQLVYYTTLSIERHLLIATQ